MEILFIWISLKILAGIFFNWVCMSESAHMCHKPINLLEVFIFVFSVWKFSFCSKLFLQVHIGDSRFENRSKIENESDTIFIFLLSVLFFVCLLLHFSQSKYSCSDVKSCCYKMKLLHDGFRENQLTFNFQQLQYHRKSLDFWSHTLDFWSHTCHWIFFFFCDHNINVYSFVF